MKENIKEVITRLLETGRPLHPVNGTHVGFNLRVTPDSEVRIEGCYNPGESITDFIGWTDDNGNTFVITADGQQVIRSMEDTPGYEPHYERDEVVYYKKAVPKYVVGIQVQDETPILLYVNSDVEIDSLKELLSKMYWQLDQSYTLNECVLSWYEPREDASTVLKCEIEVMTNHCDYRKRYVDHIGWTAFRALYHQSGFLFCNAEVVDEIIGKDSSSKGKEIVIGKFNNYIQYSGCRFKTLKEVKVNQSNPLINVTMCPSQALLIVSTNEMNIDGTYHTVGVGYHLNSVTSLALGNTDDIVQLALDKLYIEIASILYTLESPRSSRRRDNRVNIPIQTTSASLALARKFGWCLKGTQDWCARFSAVRNALREAGILDTLMGAQEWKDIPQEMLEIDITLSEQQIKEIQSKERTYTNRLFFSSRHTTIAKALVLGKEMLEKYSLTEDQTV
jgi:hypothetical protein